MTDVNNPHDKMFKETFSDVEVTADFLNHYIPEEILGIIDIETLRPLKDSFITRELEEAYSDLLFGVNIEGESGYLYFLFEHKSYETKNIAIQLMKYMAEIWDSVLTKENKDSLPIIIPLVIYHGRNEWTKAKKICELIKGFSKFPPLIQQYVPDYDFLLFDLSRFDEQDVKGTIKLRVFLDLFAHIFIQDDAIFELIVEKHVHELLEVYEEQPDIVEYFKTYIKYVLSVRENLSVHHMYEMVKSVSTKGGSLVATAAEELRKEGRIEGIKEVAKNLILLNMDEKQIIEVTNLSKEEIEKIKKSLD